MNTGLQKTKGKKKDKENVFNLCISSAPES